MWNEFYLNNKGYNVEDVKEILDFVCGQKSETIFNDLVYGTIPVEEYLSDYVSHIGCELKMEYPESNLEREFGILQSKGKIILMDELSPALDQLGIGDKILEINGSLVNEWDENISIDGDITVKIERLGEQKEIRLNKGSDLYFGYLQLHQKENASPESEEAFNKWLDQ